LLHPLPDAKAVVSRDRDRQRLARALVEIARFIALHNFGAIFDCAGARVRFGSTGRGGGSAGARGRGASLSSQPLGDRGDGSGARVWSETARFFHCTMFVQFGGCAGAGLALVLARRKQLEADVRRTWGPPVPKMKMVIARAP